MGKREPRCPLTNECPAGCTVRTVEDRVIHQPFLQTCPTFCGLQLRLCCDGRLHAALKLQLFPTGRALTQMRLGGFSICDRGGSIENPGNKIPGLTMTPLALCHA